MRNEPQRETVNRPVGRPKNKSKTKKIKAPKIMGRPKSYSEKIAAYICEQLMCGRSLTSICKLNGMPSIATIYNWLSPKSKCHNKEFLESYIVARELQADTLADQVVDIADDGRNDTYTKVNSRTGELETVVDYDNVRRSRLRVDALRWKAAHLLPRKYSKRMQVSARDDQALIPTKTTVIVHFIKNKELDVPKQNE